MTINIGVCQIQGHHSVQSNLKDNFLVSFYLRQVKKKYWVEEHIKTNKKNWFYSDLHMIQYILFWSFSLLFLIKVQETSKENQNVCLTGLSGLNI